MTATATSPQFGQDKEWIACDDWPQSPHYGNCYLSYSDTIGEEVVAQTSSDGGRTWSGLTSAPGFPGRESIRGSFAPGVQPLVLPSGRVVIAYYDEGKISALRSDDGGATWTTELGIAPADYRTHNGLRAAPLPTSAVSSDGRAYVAWTDCSFRLGCPANDVVYVSSTDGIAWSSADARSRPAAATPSCRASTPTRRVPGRLALTYYVYSGSSLDVRFVWSKNAGASWSRSQLLNSRHVPVSGIAQTSLGSMVGDYISTSFAGGRAVPVFVLASAPRNGPARGRVRDLDRGPLGGLGWQLGPARRPSRAFAPAARSSPRRQGPAAPAARRRSGRRTRSRSRRR